MNEASILQDGIRAVLWLFCQFAMWLMDLCYGIINDLATLNLGDFQFIWSWFRGVSALLYFFILIRMFIYFVKATMEEDTLQKIEPLDFLQRILYISVILVMLPTMLNGFAGLSANAVGSISSLAGVNEADTVPSHIVAAAGYNGDISTFDYETIEINKKEDGHYIQFSSNSDIVFLTFTSIIACLVFVFIGIQIAQRMIGLLLKIVIAPFALSGLINPEDNTFSIWRRLVEADFLTNFFQIVLVMIVMISASLVPVGAIAKCIFFIGALLAVMNAPAGVAQLLGGDVGVGTAFQQMQSLMMLSQGASMAGQALQTAGAAGMYLGGRSLGGRSLLSEGLGSSGTNSSPEGGSGSAPQGGTGASTPSVRPVTVGGTMPAGSGGVNSGDRMTREKWENPMTGAEHMTVARYAADRMDESNIGQIMNKGISGLYRRSAETLSRPIVKRTPGGGTVQRRNAFMKGRSVVYGAREVGRAVSKDMRGSKPQRSHTNNAV